MIEIYVPKTKHVG